MQNPIEAANYEQRKLNKIEKLKFNMSFVLTILIYLILVPK